MSIRLRIAVASALAAAALFALAGSLLVFGVDRAVDAAVEAGLRERSAALVEAVRHSRGPIALPAAPAPSDAGVLPPAEDIRQVLTVDGRIVAASEAAATRPLLTGDQLAGARRGPITVSGPVGPRGDPTRMLAVPVTTAGRPPLIAVVGASTGVTRNAVATVRTGLLITAGPAIALSGVGGWLLAGAALAPVERMRRRAEEISDRDTDARLPVPPTRDEIAALARTLNDLLARLQHALANERMLVADTGHELRTPLTALRAELELATRPGRSYDELTRAVAAAADDTERIVRLAEDLLLLAKAERNQPLLRPTPTDVEDVVSDVVCAAQPRAAERDITLTLTVEPLAPVVLDPDRLRQIVGNLLDNALRYAPSGSAVEVRVGRSEQWLVLQVADHGPGFPPAFLPHAFERFRRADSPGRGPGADGGAGLGLAIVRSLARAHGGDATAANRPGGGAVVRVTLPADAVTPDRTHTVFTSSATDPRSGDPR
jgi:signal transduction histidine kinase